MGDLNNNDVNSTLTYELLKEKRSERRWRNVRFIFWFALFAYVVFGIFTYLGSKSSSTASLLSENYAALIRLDGMIAPGRDFSGATVIPYLRDAFSDTKAAGVVLVINSPGGTPVQAAIIHDAILAYKQKYHKKVIVVGEDMLTSGAYFVAVAADKIYVNPNTLTGSVGVIVKGFGFVDMMKKIGVERRVYVSGNDKDRLDPFLPSSPEDMKKIQSVMSEVHQNFVKAVMDGRKGKLKGDPATLFTGDFWTGQAAVNLGLADNVGNLMDAMEKEFKTTEYKEYGSTSDWLQLLTGRLGTAVDRFVYGLS